MHTTARRRHNGRPHVRRFRLFRPTPTPCAIATVETRQTRSAAASPHGEKSDYRAGRRTRRTMSMRRECACQQPRAGPHPLACHKVTNSDNAPGGPRSRQNGSFVRPMPQRGSADGEALRNASKVRNTISLFGSSKWPWRASRLRCCMVRQGRSHMTASGRCRDRPERDRCRKYVQRQGSPIHSPTSGAADGSKYIRTSRAFKRPSGGNLRFATVSRHSCAITLAYAMQRARSYY